MKRKKTKPLSFLISLAIIVSFIACNRPSIEKSSDVPNGIISEVYSDMYALSRVVLDRGLESKELIEGISELKCRQLARSLSCPPIESDRHLAFRLYSDASLENLSKLKRFPFITPNNSRGIDIYVHQSVVDLFNTINFAQVLIKQFEEDETIKHSLRVTMARAAASILILESEGFDVLSIKELYFDVRMEKSLLGDLTPEISNIAHKIIAGESGYDYAYGYRPSRDHNR